MARKRLIRGANATRVEERIARVPEDIEAESNIFRALKELEGSPPDAPLQAPASLPAPGSKRTPRAAKRPARRAIASQPPAAPIISAAEPQGELRPRKRIGPSDFSAAEREAIVRCCADYRNRLPIYLMAVQKEVEIIDSVIEKCSLADKDRRKP
ncbi:MAG: hypothetical protein ACLQMF_19760 [Rectinemataceae bacterium]